MQDEGLSEALLDRLGALATERGAPRGRDQGRDPRDKDSNVDNLRTVASRLHARATTQGE